MKPVSQEIIEILTDLWKDEIGAFLQYMAHYFIIDNFGYKEFAEYIKARADEELNDHSIMLAKRIAFLQGKPPSENPSSRNVVYEVMTDKKKIMDLLTADHEAEKKAIDKYRAKIRRVEELGDFETGKILRDILSDEEKHANGIEEHTDQLKHVGVELFLNAKMDKK